MPPLFHLGFVSRFMVSFLSWMAVYALFVFSQPAHADVFSNVPEAADFNIAYELSIPLNGAFQGTTAVPYTVNNSATAAPGGFDKVGYYLELINESGTRWVFASMDAFTNVVTRTGLPHNINNPFTFQQSVNNLAVYSNVSGVKTGSFDRGQIEMWHQNYSVANANAVFGASAGTFDWGDTIGTTASGYGCFQIHNPGARQVVLAYNRWANATSNDDVGIGNSTASNPDWTSTSNTGNYTSRKLIVLVRPKRFDVAFTAVPANQQVTPRNVATNTAVVPITGTETVGGFDQAVLKVFRNGEPHGADAEVNLTYTSGSAGFSFSPTITAELASYTFEIYLKQAANSYLVRRITDVTAGDAYIWYGQSNAEANVRSGTGSSNAYASPWIRTFGMSSDDATVTQAYPFWVEGDGDGSRNIPAGVGQWALVVGRKIVEDYGIPVAILNGSRGGYSMPQLQRDDANLNSLADSPTVFRVYNRLRYRANLAKVAAGVRGIFFYQGESDADDTAQHMSGFASLLADWRTDYPAVEKIFVSQLHVGCSTTRELPELRDAQRLLPDLYDKTRVMSTNGLTTYSDNCHYPFTGGYETHGLNVFRQVARDLYGAPDAPDIDAPNPARVEIANEAGTRLRIVLRKPGAAITVDPGSLTDFRLNGSSALLLSATPTSTGIELQYDGPVTAATSLDYLAHIGSAGGWVRNGNRVGLLTFSEPVLGNHPTVTLVSPSAVAELAPGTVFPLSATASTPAGTVSRFEVFVDGILHTAVEGQTTISANWQVPASGKHKLLFRATNSAGSTAEKSVVVFAGSTPSPAGVSAGLSVWLKPESGIESDAEGVVSAWRDSSGNDHHCSQPTVIAKPDYASGSFGTMPGVAFDGDDWLTAAAGMSTGSYTKIVRVMLSDLAQPGNMLSSASSSGSRHALYMAGTSQPRLWNSSTFVTSSTPMVAGQGHVIVATYDSATKSGTLYLDGVQVGTGTATANPSDPGYQLGALASSNFMRGVIGEAIIYNRVIDSSERASVENYLAAKIQPPANTPLLTYEAWCAANLPPTADRDANGDADGNGIANLVEFALGLPPGTSGVPVHIDLQNDGGIVEVRYARPTDRTGVFYQLLESPDLVTWSPVADSGGAVSAGFEQRVHSRSLAPQQKTFFRLRVTLAP